MTAAVLQTRTPPTPYVPPDEVKKIGHITPSSNTVMEPLTYAINLGFNGAVSHHFSRITVHQLALHEKSESQFQLDRMLEAARLLADSPLDVILWNGTSASWRGIENDLTLCEAITKETGIQATTSSLAIYNAYKRNGWKRIALAVPYTLDVTRKIEVEYARQGYEVVASAAMEVADNTDIGRASPDRIRALLREATAGKPDCIAVVCTNFAATALVEEMEEELSIPIVDSIGVTVLEACLMCGITPKLKGWGRLLAGA